MNWAGCVYVLTCVTIVFKEKRPQFERELVGVRGVGGRWGGKPSKCSAHRWSLRRVLPWLLSNKYIVSVEVTGPEAESIFVVEPEVFKISGQPCMLCYPPDFSLFSNTVSCSCFSIIDTGLLCFWMNTLSEEFWEETSSNVFCFYWDQQLFVFLLMYEGDRQEIRAH